MILCLGFGGHHAPVHHAPVVHAKPIHHAPVKDFPPRPFAYEFGVQVRSLNFQNIAKDCKTQDSYSGADFAKKEVQSGDGIVTGEYRSPLRNITFILLISKWGDFWQRLKKEVLEMIPASLFSVQSRPARWPHTDCDVHCRPLQRLRCRCEIRRSRCVSCRAPASRPCSSCPCSSCPCSPCPCTSCPSPPWATWTGWLLGIKE